MTPDGINGAFEVIGSVAVWANFCAVVKDRGYAGTRWPMMVFFMSWGMWNLYFYPHLGQAISFYASWSLSLANASVLAAMIYFGKKP
jgi:hypothetical protein